MLCILKNFKYISNVTEKPEQWKPWVQAVIMWEQKVPNGGCDEWHFNSWKINLIQLVLMIKSTRNNL